MYDCINVGGTDWTVQYLTFSGLADPDEYGVLIGQSGFTGRYLTFIDCGESNSSEAPIRLSGSLGTCTLDHIRIYGNDVNNGRSLIDSTATSGTINLTNSLILGLNTGIVACVGLTNATNLTVYNSTILGGQNSAIGNSYNSTTAINLNVVNSVVMSAPLVTTNGFGISAGHANTAVNCSYSLVSSGFMNDGNNCFSGGTQTISNMIDEGPGFVIPGKNTGCVALTMDWDNYSAEVMKDVADVFAEKGVGLTCVVNAAYFAPIGSQLTADIAACYNKGVDIGSHGWSHTSIGDGELKAFNMYYVGSGTCTLTVANNTLATEITGGGAEEELNIDLTQYASTSGVDALTAHINAKADYVATTTGREVVATAQATSLADVTAQDITAIGKIYTLLTNPARLYRDEILDNNQWVETTIGGGYECVSYAYAGNSEDANTLAYLQSFDGTSAGQRITSSAGGDLEDNSDLTSFDPFRVYRISPTAALDTFTQQQREWWFRDMGMDATIRGKIVFAYFHADDFDDGDNDLSEAEKQSIRGCLDALISTGAVVGSQKSVMAYITGNGWTWNAGTSKWEKALADSGDYRPTGGSALVGAGTNDPDGDGTPNIIEGIDGSTSKPECVTASAYQYERDNNPRPGPYACGAHR